MLHTTHINIPHTTINSRNLPLVFETMTSRVGPQHSAKSSQVKEFRESVSFDICGRDVTYKPSKTSRRVLDAHNWHFRSAQLSAILGPSGCGKSTLLRILLGRVSGRRITGYVGISQQAGNEQTEENTQVRVAFVGQDDHLSSFLSVEESLLLATRLKNANVSTNVVHRSRIEKAASLLSLESALQTKVGRLSGGQKRRLSIALELLGSPSVLILDEPTTGLDSGSTQHLVRSLRKLVRRTNRMAIIATIHQPSARVFALFDHIHVMSKFGRVLYADSPSLLLPILVQNGLNCPEFHNPADFIIELAAGDFGFDKAERLCDHSDKRRKESDDLNDTVRQTLTVEWPKHSFTRQVLRLMVYVLISNLREPFVFFIRALEPPLIGLNNALIFGQIGGTSGCVPSLRTFFAIPPGELFDRQDSERWDVYQNSANLFFAALNFFYVGMTPTLLFFPRELAIVSKQHTNGWHSVAAYFVAKVIVELFFLAIAVYSFTSIWYVVSDQDPTQQSIRYWGVFAVLGVFHLFGFFQGLIFSGIFATSPITCVYSGVLSMLPFILMSGFVVRTNRIIAWLKPITLGSYYRFGFEILLLIMYGNGRCEKLNELEEAKLNVTGDYKFKAPKWLRLTSFLDTNSSKLTVEQLGEKTLNQWFQRTNPKEQSWILDEMDLSNDGKHDILLVRHSVCFVGLLILWMIIAYMIMRRRMIKPPV